MKLAVDTRNKIIHDGLISLFIYALPVVLMLLYFSLTGQKPWLKHPVKSATTILKH